MIRSLATTAILAVVLTACAMPGDTQGLRGPEPAYVPSHDAARAPLLSGATVTGDTIREDK